MRVSNRYAKHMKKFSVRLMVTSHDYGKLTQPVRGSEMQEILLLPPLIPVTSLELASHQKHILLKTMQ